MTPVDPQLRAVLEASIAGLTIGIITLSISLFSLAEHLRRGRTKSRLLLWFGLFAGMYGLRVLARTGAVRLLLDVPAEWWDGFSTFVDFTILIPTFLFWEEIYGPGWRSSVRWLVWIAAGYGVIALTLRAVLQGPSVLPEPGGLVLIVVPAVLLANYLLGYRPPPMAEARILIVGLSVFVVFVMNSHLGRWSVLLGGRDPEPFGFLFFLCCLGWIAAHRYRNNELQLWSLEEEMKAARRIQESILPAAIPGPPGLEVAVRYSPMTAVAGDFYDFLSAGAQHLGVLVADVAGHGVPAALGASMVKVAISTQFGNACDPAQLMAGLNDTMHRAARGQLVTAGFLSLDLQAGAATYAGAGHPPLLLWRPSTQTLHEFNENGLLLGVLANQKYPSMRFEIDSGDRIIMVTDGVWEAENRTQEIYGDARFKQFIAERGHLQAHDIASGLLDEVNAWSTINGSRKQADDITVVVLGVK